ncbi:hypothetical protein GF415_02915 [Candidatus Micrarchaeota archaeon]|nr:hypothetical protein [Candidatus Micrarchaeota archaeon]
MKLEFVEFYAGDVRRNSPKPPESFNTNITLTDAFVEKDALSLNFEYTVNYSPGNSGMHLTGKAVFAGKEAKKAHAEWEKKKTIGGKMGEYIVNALYYHSALNAIPLSSMFGLVPPVVLPEVKFSKKKA